MAIDFLQFFFNFIIASFLLRFAQVKLSGSDFGKALAFIN